MVLLYCINVSPGGHGEAFSIEKAIPAFANLPASKYFLTPAVINEQHRRYSAVEPGPENIVQPIAIRCKR